MYKLSLPVMKAYMFIMQSQLEGAVNENVPGDVILAKVLHTFFS